MELHVLPYIWFAYGWPSVKGNGPEAVLELALLSLFIPAVRRFLRRGLTAIHQKLDSLGEHHTNTQQMLQHIIKHHPDIPPLPKDAP